MICTQCRIKPVKTTVQGFPSSTRHQAEYEVVITTETDIGRDRFRPARQVLKTQVCHYHQKRMVSELRAGYNIQVEEWSDE